MRAKITERNLRFVDFYVGEAAGNGTEAMRMAGMEGTNATLSVTAQRALRLPSVREAIERRKVELEKGVVAKITEIHERWTAILRNDSLDPKYRLKAGELLAKCRGEFAPDRLKIEAQVEVVFTPEQDEALKTWMLVKDDPRVQLAIADALRERQGEG